MAEESREDDCRNHPAWGWWFEEGPQSFDDIALTVAIEGATRLVGRPTAAEQRRLFEALKAQVGFPLANEVDVFINHLHNDNREVAARLAIALGHLPMVGTFEDWLQAGIAAAGLRDFEAGALPDKESAE